MQLVVLLADSAQTGSSEQQEGVSVCTASTGRDAFGAFSVSFCQSVVFPLVLSFPHITVVCSLLPFHYGGLDQVNRLV